MIVVIGLGNPGSRYEKTRHNVGFEAVSKAAAFLHVKLRKRCFRLYRQASVRNEAKEQALLVQPLTYMNASGKIMDAFSREDSHVQVNLLLPEGEAPPEELRPEQYDSSKVFDDLGYHISVAVRHIPQEDYDRLEDVSYGKIDVDYQDLVPAYR